MSAARRNRRSQHNYLPKVMALAAANDLPAGSVSEVVVRHDAWCRISKGLPCNCDPEVALAAPPADARPVPLACPRIGSLGDAPVPPGTLTADCAKCNAPIWVSPSLQTIVKASKATPKFVCVECAHGQ